MSDGKVWLSALACRRWLLGLLVVLLTFLGVFWKDLQLGYQLNSAEQAIGSRDFAAARDILLACGDRRKTSPRWHYLLARAQRRGGDLVGAGRNLDLASKAGWDESSIDRQRLLSQAQTGAIKGVEPRLKVLLGQDHSDDDAEEIYEAMARGYLSAFYVNDATQCLDSWAAWQPDNPTPILWLADLHQLLDQHQEAVQLYRRVLDIKPDNHEARLKLGRSLAALSRLDEAAETFEACLDLNHQGASDAFVGLADVKRRQGFTEDARFLLYDALTLDLPHDRCAVVLAELGEIAMEERQYSEAMFMLSQSLQYNPDLIAGRQAMASLLTAIGNKDLAAVHREAIEDLRRRKKAFTDAMRQSVFDSRSAEHRATAGLALLEQGPSDEAEDWLLSAIEIDPGHRGAHEGLARYYELTGDASRSKQHAAAAKLSASPPAGQSN